VILMSGDPVGVLQARDLARATDAQHPAKPVLGFCLQRRAHPGWRQAYCTLRSVCNFHLLRPARPWGCQACLC
jgi:hypothetical protein